MESTQEKLSLSERLKNYEENAKGSIAANSDYRATENMTSPRKLPNGPISTESSDTFTSSPKRPQSASDNSTKQAFSLAKEAFASPAAPRRRRSTANRGSVITMDTEVAKGAVSKSKELLGGQNNASSATTKEQTSAPADISEEVTKEAFAKAKGALTTAASTATAESKTADISEEVTKEAFAKAKGALTTAASTATAESKTADISEALTKNVFSKAKDAFTSNGSSQSQQTGSIAITGSSPLADELSGTATKDVFSKAKNAFTSGNNTSNQVENQQQPQPLSRRQSIRDAEKISVKERISTYSLGRESIAESPSSPVPAPRRKQSFVSFKQALGELKHVENESTPSDYVPPRKASSIASSAATSPKTELSLTLPTTSSKAVERPLSIVAAAVANYTHITDNMAQNQPTSPSSTNSTTANANALNSPSSARRRSLAAVVADTEKVKNTSTDQFGSTQESNLSIAKEYTGSKAVNEVIRAILNADPTINWAIFNYERGNLVTDCCGNSDFETFRNSFKDDCVSYGYWRTAIGVERRTKFVFFKWVGENAKPLQRARAFEGSKKAMEMIRVYHLELPVSKQADLAEKTIWERLTMAAGANYDKEQNTVSQNTKNITGSEFHSYKLSSKQFFENIEKSGTIKSVVYESKPMPRNTPVSLGVRPISSPISIRAESNFEHCRSSISSSTGTGN